MTNDRVRALLDTAKAQITAWQARALKAEAEVEKLRHELRVEIEAHELNLRELGY
ncbi:hypothetical protein ABQE69_09145 [Mycolicibacillus trivialis]